MDQLGQVLAQIAKELNLTVSQLWPQIVAVTFWQSLFWVVADPLLVAVGVVLVIRSWSWVRSLLAVRDTGDRFSNPVYVREEGQRVLGVIGLILLWVIVAGVIIGTLTSYPDQVAGVLAPEGMTAVRLLKAATTK